MRGVLSEDEQWQKWKEYATRSRDVVEFSVAAIVKRQRKGKKNSQEWLSRTWAQGKAENNPENVGSSKRSFIKKNKKKRKQENQE